MNERVPPGADGNHDEKSAPPYVTVAGYIPIMNSSSSGSAHTMRTQNLGLSREKPVSTGTVAIGPDAPKPLSGMAKTQSGTAKIQAGGPPGSRSRHLGIKRGMHTVGLVRWCRNHPRIKENLSGGVGFVRWGRNGLWDEMWDFRAIAVVQREESPRARVNKRPRFDFTLAFSDSNAIPEWCNYNS